MTPAGSDNDGSGKRDDLADVVMVLTVVDDREVAGRLAETAVEEHLAACTQVEGPLHSTYRWAGKLCSDEEWRVVAKSTSAGASALVEHWATAHPYDVPEILVVPVLGGHVRYLQWVDSEVRSTPL